MIVEFARRKICETYRFLRQLLESGCITLPYHLTQELLVGRAIWEVATSTQQEGLVDHRLEMPMR